MSTKTYKITYMQSFKPAGAAGTFHTIRSQRLEATSNQEAREIFYAGTQGTSILGVFQINEVGAIIG